VNDRQPMTSLVVSRLVFEIIVTTYVLFGPKGVLATSDRRVGLLASASVL